MLVGYQYLLRLFEFKSKARTDSAGLSGLVPVQWHMLTNY